MLWVFSCVSSFAVNTGHSRWEKGRIFLRRSKRETKFGVQLTGMDLNEEIWHISILLEAEEFQACSSMFFFWWKYGVFGKPRSSQCWSLLFCTVSNIYKEIGNTQVCYILDLKFNSFRFATWKKTQVIYWDRYIMTRIVIGHGIHGKTRIDVVSIIFDSFPYTAEM